MTCCLFLLHHCASLHLLLPNRPPSTGKVLGESFPEVTTFPIDAKKIVVPVVFLIQCRALLKKAHYHAHLVSTIDRSSFQML